MNVAFLSTKKNLLLSLGIVVCSFSGLTQNTDTLTQIITFDLKKQPAEASGREYEIGLNPNIISSAHLSSLPDGAAVVEVRFMFPSLKTTGNSFGTDVLFGFSGAVSAGYDYGDKAPESAGQFDFNCVYDNSSVNISGGRINLHYYDMVNDNAGSETIFNTGKEVASLQIRYTVAPKPETDETRSEYFVIPGIFAGSNEAAVQVYPNPSDGQIFISAGENAIATVYDMQGKMILENKVQNGKMLDISDANPGIYTIRIATENTLTTSKIIKL